jgi:hypothetical protein
MKRTLLAVGIAVLVSMMLAPHGDKSGVDGWGLFFSWYYLDYSAAEGWDWTGRSKVMIDMLILQTVFLAVLAAVLVNLRKSWGRKKPVEKHDNAKRP